MKITHKTQKKSWKAPFFIIISVIVIMSVGYFSYAYITKTSWPFNSNTAQQPKNEVTNPGEGINYEPPTDQEIDSSQDGKKNSTSQEDNSAAQESTRTASVAIAYAGYDNEEDAIDIRAFTSSVIEGTGTCTATLKKDNRTVTRTSKAFIDSSSSQCEPIIISLNDFPSGGTWNLIVTYSSDTAKGVSSIVKVEVSR